MCRILASYCVRALQCKSSINLFPFLYFMFQHSKSVHLSVRPSRPSRPSRPIFTAQLVGRASSDASAKQSASQKDANATEIV